MPKVTRKLEISTRTDRRERRRLFDEATERQRQRGREGISPTTPASDRGWTRAGLGDRGSAH